tara:strand:- start:3305 stop:5302 length:1998 start_codon:yes stop_codon:yes gene_type:complete
MMNTTKKASAIMKPTGILLSIVAAAVAAVVLTDPGTPTSHDQPDRQITAAATISSTTQWSQSQSASERVAESAASGQAVATLPQSLAPVAPTYASDFVGPSQFAFPATKPDADTIDRNATSAAPRDKLSGPVAALLAAGATGDIELVVRYDQRPELFDDERVAELGGTVTRSYEHLDMRAVRLPVAALLNLAADENVDWLSLDEEMSVTSVASREAANFPGASSTNGGYRGLNVGVAILDTGVSEHTDLSDSIVQYSFLGGSYPTPAVADGNIVTLNDSGRGDGFGHGTHVAGLIGGSGEKSKDKYIGAANTSKILSLQVLDENGGGSMSDVMAALDWLLTYGEYFDIRVVNLSLGKGISESNATDPLVLAVERLWDAGMVVVVAAGNDGYSGSMTITSPANSRKVITVGSLTDNGTGSDFSDDFVSSFSSQGPTIGDYVLKPDLLAPGNRLTAAVSKKSFLATALSSRLTSCLLLFCSGSDAYLEMSGTSMAAPVVTATVALMLEKDPSLSPATVKARLMRSAHKLDADPTEAGAGLLDADAALNDSGVVTGQALSPLMIFDTVSDTVLVEDTAILWGDDLWGSAYLYNNGVNWASGATYVDENGVSANGYMWTDGGVSAKGYMWTDGGVSAKGYMWTDGVNAKSLFDGTAGSGMFLNDDGPAE